MCLPSLDTSSGDEETSKEPCWVIDTCEMAGYSGLPKFDPELHKGNTYDAFVDFVDSFVYEYDAIAKEPPNHLKEPAEIEVWIQQNKRKQFLGRFASRNFQKDYEEEISLNERSNISFTRMVEALKQRYKPTKNTTLSNFEFHKLEQKETESFDLFVNRVKHEAASCEFKCGDNCTVQDILVRDQIIVRTFNDEIRKNALKQQWGLQELILNGRSLEAASEGASKIAKNNRLPSSDRSSDIRKVRKPGKYSRKKKAHDKLKQVTRSKSTCSKCSSASCDGGKICPARKIVCFKCGKKGHFKGSKACKGRDRQANRVEDQSSSPSPAPSCSDTETSEDTTSESEEEIASTKRISRKHIPARRVSKVRKPNKIRQVSTKPRYQVQLVINEKTVDAFADTGADISVMSRELANELNLPLSKTKMKLKPYGSKSINCVGLYQGTVMCGEGVANVRIYVVKQNVEFLLSGIAAEDLGIIKFNSHPRLISKSNLIRRAGVKKDEQLSQVVTAHKNVFNGIGLLKDYQEQIHIDEEVQPVAEQPRPIPFHLRQRFKNEIERMEEQGIIEEHDGPAPWVSNAVLAPKDDGGIRVTVDMRNANKAILDTNVPIPREEDIRVQLSGCQYFTKLDFKSAFHQLEIAPESRYITVFYANGKLMRYKRLTMSTKPASGELHRALQLIFADIPEAHVLHDDVIIATETNSRHHEVLDSVLTKLSQKGLTLNPEKCIFAKQEVPFWGMVISKDGVRPDPSKVDALKDAEPPRSKEEVVSFLCMIQSHAEFIPMLSKKTVYMRALTKKHARFVWSKECQKEFETLKGALCKETLLNFFDPSLNTYLLTDAHITGISAIIAQGQDLATSKPIAFASRATSPVERRYAQLDLEALSVDFALRRFRNYLVGGPTVQIYTDHKPLISIFADRRKGSVRIDRIKLRHQDISYDVMWLPGKKNPADYLSRHSKPFPRLPTSWKKETSELEKTVWFLQYSPYTESISMETIIQETENDPRLQNLKTAIKKGYIAKSNTPLKPYRQVFNEITVSDEGLILKKEKIVLPESLWQTAIDKAHQGGHPGLSRMKRRLRSHFWFPSLDQKVSIKVNECQGCQLFTRKTTKEPLKPTPLPETAWEDVNIDLFGPMPDKRHVLVVQDSYSRFPAAKIVPSTKSTPVLNALNDIYLSYGNPERHRTDNGPPFNGREFAEFSKQNSIQHTKVFPYHAQANPAETFMRPLGKAMKIANDSGQNRTTALNDLLIGYRSTPHPATGLSPGNMLFRHGYHHDFPRTNNSDQETAAARDHDWQQRQARNHQQNESVKRKATTFDIGDQVLVTNMNRQSKYEPLFERSPYTVISIDGSGLILCNPSTNQVIRRHKDYVKTYHQPLHQNNFHLDQPDDMPDDNIRDDIYPAIQNPNAPIGTNAPRRSQRERRAPKHLNDYEIDI